jgi:hypothetical protein
MIQAPCTYQRPCTVSFKLIFLELTRCYKTIYSCNSQKARVLAPDGPFLPNQIFLGMAMNLP